MNTNNAVLTSPHPTGYKTCGAGILPASGLKARPYKHHAGWKPAPHKTATRPMQLEKWLTANRVSTGCF